ncbi:hypothetical protein MWU58_10300 [Flavobacteriaceae bacterium S0825]|uniref:hypothetical protein n=1 Tax=Gaetbulibacter sp. S0825 TaxID=2720084 RepID=UPI001430329A|nr:hypothetical protein [Gaetbulibacter sp. S0825]MCK0109686.1 hypothetical protein [Flavobacteriaceae bacterium S0825]NIX65318.1 hypothetical protein [Gaetbulibacter sp. S0825]
MNKSTYIKAIEWGRTKSSGFTEDEILGISEITSAEQKIISRHCRNALWNENKERPPKNSMFTVLNSNRLIVTLESEFNYINFLELNHARKNAKYAFILSVIAIVVSAIGYFL